MEIDIQFGIMMMGIYQRAKASVENGTRTLVGKQMTGLQENCMAGASASCLASAAKLVQKAAVGGCSATGSLENVAFALFPPSSILSHISFA